MGIIWFQYNKFDFIYVNEHNVNNIFGLNFLLCLAGLITKVIDFIDNLSIPNLLNETENLTF